MLRLRGKHILVLENERLISMTLAEDLVEAGATVTVAYSRREALEAVRSKAFDAGSLDMHLGHGDCTEVAEALLKEGVPFILTTGDTHCDSLGSGARLIKPFTSKELIE